MSKRTGWGLRRFAVALGMASVLAGLPLVAWSAPLPPANDDLSAAEPLDGYPVDAKGSNAGATREAGEPRPCGEMEATIWYSWVAPVTGPVQTDTRGSQFDADVAVYQGTGFDDLALVGCDSDDYWMQARVVFEAIAGERYLIQLGCNCGGGSTAVISVGPKEDFGRLGGTVTDEVGQPIPGACVGVTSEDRMSGRSLSTGADGRWEIEIGPGSYYLDFSDCGDDHYRSEWWEDQPTWESADLVTVPPGGTVHLPVALEPARSTPPPGTEVDVAIEAMTLRRASPSELVEDPRPWRVVVEVVHLAGSQPQPVELVARARPITFGQPRPFAEASLVLQPGAVEEVVLPWDGSRIVGDAEVSAFIDPLGGTDRDPDNNHHAQVMTVTGVPLGAGIRPA